MTMELREKFGVPARGFSITLSLQEGYGGGGAVHKPEEVLDALLMFARSTGIEISGSLREEEIFYSYHKGPNDLVWAREPGVVVSGLFPPNKFGWMSESRLVDIIAKMVEWLAKATGQVSVHAQVCGKHYAWKQQGEKTAREIAQAS